MAAPMSEETMSDPDDEEPEEINPLSPHFNPLRALYSSQIVLPFPKASVFDNLHQYEKVTSSREQARQVRGGARDRADGGGRGMAAPYGGKPQGPARPVVRENLQRDGSIQSLRSKRNEPVQLGTGFRATKDMLIDTQKHKPIIYRNALTRMSEYATGPLSVLYRCMNERCKVRVCTRSFKGLRSICTGYVVTFDKFFNMALVDVDETWKRPATGQRFYHEEKLTFSKIMESSNYKPKASLKSMALDNSRAQRSAASTSHPQRDSNLQDRDKLRTSEKSGSTDTRPKPSTSHSRDGGCSDKREDLPERRSKPTQEECHRNSQEDKEKEHIKKDLKKHSLERLQESSSKEPHKSRSLNADSQKHIPKGSRESSRKESRESSRKGSQRSSCKGPQETGEKDSTEHSVKGTRRSRQDLQNRGSKPEERRTDKLKRDRGKEKAKMSEKESQQGNDEEEEADDGGGADDEDDIESLQRRFAALQKELTSLSDNDVEAQKEEGEEVTAADIESLQKHFAALREELTMLSDEEKEKGKEEGEGATETEVKNEDLESVTYSQSRDIGQPTTTYQHQQDELAGRSNEAVDIKGQAGHRPEVKCDITQHSQAAVHKETDASGSVKVEHSESEARTKVPGGGRLKIKPEDFRRRHVNQLFIRGDNVVLVSVDSNLLPR